jgi:hypothetical protein
MKPILFLLLILAACNNNKLNSAPPPPPCPYDSMRVSDSARIASLEAHIADLLSEKKEVIHIRDKRVEDSLITALFIANYKVERVRYYLNICLKNPSQDKFLKGWIRRAIQ